jgi:hypothetical protein
MKLAIERSGSFRRPKPDVVPNLRLRKGKMDTRTKWIKKWAEKRTDGFGGGDPLRDQAIANVRERQQRELEQFRESMAQDALASTPLLYAIDNEQFSFLLRTSRYIPHTKSELFSRGIMIVREKVKKMSVASQDSALLLVSPPLNQSTYHYWICIRFITVSRREMPRQRRVQAARRVARNRCRH